GCRAHYSALTRPLCELSALVPPQLLVSHKKLKVYSMVAHPLQPHLVATGTNIGIILCEFDQKSLPPFQLSTPVLQHSEVMDLLSDTGRYLAIVWPDIPYFSIYKVSDWSVVDSGGRKAFGLGYLPR
ncbi:hypothetical protein HAX54_047611, partial [Datura stramonium]|nr:hypothetical protein [Datura stramonium]